jgi:hypothetical protein
MKSPGQTVSLLLPKPIISVIADKTSPAREAKPGKEATNERTEPIASIYFRTKNSYRGNIFKTGAFGKVKK